MPSDRAEEVVCLIPECAQPYEAAVHTLNGLCGCRLEHHLPDCPYVAGHIEEERLRAEVEQVLAAGLDEEPSGLVAATPQEIACWVYDILSDNDYEVVKK